LAVHLASRFPYPRVQKEVRWLLLNFPAKAAGEPEAIPVLINGALPDDVSFQLKVGHSNRDPDPAFASVFRPSC
jgi:phosphatidylinositol 4-kinase